MVLGTLLLKPLFILAIGMGILLTAVALFTPGWRQFYASQGNVDSLGIIIGTCNSGATPEHGSDNELDEGNMAAPHAPTVEGERGTGCRQWFSSQPAWEKAIIVLLLVALALQMVVLLWALLSCCAFCLPSLFYPLPFMCGVIAALLVVAVGIFGAHHGPRISVPSSVHHFVYAQSNVGYSFWVGVAASVVWIAATFLGCATAAAGDVNG